MEEISLLKYMFIVLIPKGGDDYIDLVSSSWLVYFNEMAF